MHHVLLVTEQYKVVYEILIVSLHASVSLRINLVTALVLFQYTLHSYTVFTTEQRYSCDWKPYNYTVYDIKILTYDISTVCKS